jgi:hypothetical protein
MNRVSFLSTRQVADVFGLAAWQIRRLFEDGDLPEPSRFAGKRAISRNDLPRIADALRHRGWLAKSSQEANHRDV